MSELKKLARSSRAAKGTQCVPYTLETYVFRGKTPWTLRQHADHTALKKASECPKIEYPKPDGKVSFDRLSSVFIANTNT